MGSTKAAWEGYADGNEVIVSAFEKAEDEMNKIKKKFDVETAKEDLAKRQEILNRTKADYETMGITLPDDKKAVVKKELDALTEKMTILLQFEEKVKKIEDFCQDLECFDNTSKSLDDWMNKAAKELNK